MAEINGEILELYTEYLKHYIDRADTQNQENLTKKKKKTTFQVQVNGTRKVAQNNIVDLGDIIDNVSAETTTTTSGSIAHIDGSLLTLKMPYVTTELNGKWLNVWNTTDNQWEQILLSALTQP